MYIINTRRWGALTQEEVWVSQVVQFLLTLKIYTAISIQNGHSEISCSTNLIKILNYFSFIDSRERGREGDREGENINGRGKHPLVAPCTRPYRGQNPQASHVPWRAIKPATFTLVGWCPTNGATLAGAHLNFKNTVKFFKESMKYLQKLYQS